MRREASRLLLIWLAALTAGFVVLVTLYFAALFIFAWMFAGIGADD